MKKGSMMGRAEGISRRNFVTGAVLAGSLAAAGMAGCAPQNSAAQAGAPTGSSSTEKDDPWAIEELGEPSETISCDLCVVGGGGTGLAAGIQAQQLGVDVVVLEKKNSTGGSFIGSEGLFAVGSHWQDDAGVSYSVDELAEACFDYHHWIPNPALYKNFFKHTADTVVWLEDLGLSSTTCVECKAVIVGTGGWANSPELIRELNGSDPDRVTASGMDGRDGDGLKMLKDVGAALAAGPGTMATYGPILPGTTYGTQLQAATSLEPHLWVNENGSRFVREDMFLKNFAYAGNAVHNQKRAFTVCNKDIMDRYMNDGGDVGVGVYVVAGDPMTDLAEELPKLLESNSEYVFQADTVEELAEQMGIDPESLAATLESYKRSMRTGR